MTKIYDCFTFYNELDLLELRLAELYNKVDHFVIVESNQTFTNNKKTFNFEHNKTRYTKYLDKIIYIKVEDMPNSENPWDNEHHQRNAIGRGIQGADLDDIIIVSDADEIPRQETIDRLRDSDQTIFALRMPLYNFKFNYMRSSPGQYDVWGMATRKATFDTILPNTLRDMRFSFMHSPFQFCDNGCELIEHAGWHFGYIGDNEHLKNKIQNFSHQESNRPELIAQIDVVASIAQRKEWNRNSQNIYKIVELDNYFPKELVNNKNKYSQWILDNPEAKVIDIVPTYNYN